MVNYFKRWFDQNFSDPHAVSLVLTIVGISLVLYFYSSLLAPIIVALAIAYLLDAPVTKIEKLGLSRSLSTSFIILLFVSLMLVIIVGLLPLLWGQVTSLITEAPDMVHKAKAFLLNLPEKYPDFIQVEQIESLNTTVQEKLLEVGQVIIQASLSSISNVVALIVYTILVPLMAFFFLKDKVELSAFIKRFLPKDRRLTSQVGQEMNMQIMNYLRGKVIEIAIVGIISTIAFSVLGLRFSILLGFLVGLSVLIPFVGATIVTIPVMLVGLFQWGVSPQLGYLMLAYFIIQILDGNVLVPILFSEAVNLHPVMIILAVIFFGGLWGVWGVFFAIPLATLLKAIVNAWPKEEVAAA